MPRRTTLTYFITLLLLAFTLFSRPFYCSPRSLCNGCIQWTRVRSIVLLYPIFLSDYIIRTTLVLLSLLRSIPLSIQIVSYFPLSVIRVSNLLLYLQEWPSSYSYLLFNTGIRNPILPSISILRFFNTSFCFPLSVHQCTISRLFPLAFTYEYNLSMVEVMSSWISEICIVTDVVAL